VTGATATTRRSTARRTSAGATSGVIVHANLLAGDLVARGGIRGLDFACLGQHLVDVAVRNQHSAGGVGEHVLAGHHAYALGDYWNIWLKRRKLSPPQRVASPEQ
jgi:hypothetical protein